MINNNTNLYLWIEKSSKSCLLPSIRRRKVIAKFVGIDFRCCLIKNINVNDALGPSAIVVSEEGVKSMDLRDMLPLFIKYASSA